MANKKANKKPNRKNSSKWIRKLLKSSSILRGRLQAKLKHKRSDVVRKV